MTTPFTPLLINGQFRPASSGKTFEVHNPYSGELVGTAAAATSQDCKDAIDAAGKAFPTWEKTPLALRRDIMLKAADLLVTDKYRKKVHEALKDETATVDPLLQMLSVEISASVLKDSAGLINKLKGETFNSDMPGAYVIGQRRAMGVILGLAPWNAPVLLSIRAACTAIICGNTVVFQASEVSPRSLATIGEVLTEAGLPAGVLNFISINRSEAPTLTTEMIANPLIRKINFCGSERIGKIIAQEAAKWLKPCIFELGGKSPVLVLDDADLEDAARAIVSSAFFFSGQTCMSTERVIVQRGAAEKLVSLVKQIAAPIKAGNYADFPKVQLSALFTAASAENVVNMVKEAQADGAEVILGDVKREGNVVQPHIITSVRPGMRLWDRESFGPVVMFVTADTIDEMVNLANETAYTLAAAVWTTDIHTAFDITSRIRTGISNINGPSFHHESQLGHGGLGGPTGYGRFNVEDFTDHRVVVVHPRGPKPYPLLGPF
ncbi:hypothetical protein QCA50_009102 [Cerrena zonata]|uniref:Aldehyde dehydrogenase domain-containing protein n=1 Tax=Cerrena zonata TaxID=2478898 RepID=A0AAW0G3H2_9APHY